MPSTRRTTRRGAFIGKDSRAAGAAAPAQCADQADEGTRLRQEYRYAHDEADAYAAGETYLPDGMRDPHWYEPTPRGLEGKIGEKLARLADLDAQWRRENKK